nr:integral membrane protease of the rhomboid family [Melanopsichium pennsylvanicum 4]
MLTSVFSHQTFLHYLFNNVALWSIGGSAMIVCTHINSCKPVIPEASLTPQYLTFFATAGVFAATVSHIVSAIRFRRVVKLTSLSTAKQTVGRQGSLGASGAVYGALVISALAFPDAQLGIIFLPFITFPIRVGVAGLMAADIAGILLRWRMFDHWAHLGGAAFGFIYWYLGAKSWEALKTLLIKRVKEGEYND